MMSEPEVLFAEAGGRWRSVVWGPLLCLLGVVLELSLRIPVHWFTWVVAALLLAGITALQVLGARKYGVVRLTALTLRQGTEELPVADIVGMFDEPGERAWDDDTFDWEAAPALGESVSVPRRHTGIGLELSDGRLTQAWAHDDAALRAALEQVLHK